MKKMEIFEPAMCCSTGLCGVGVDPELLRISTVLNNLNSNGIEVMRYNLTSAPMEFVNNKVANDFVNSKGVDGLPVILLDGTPVIEGRYPSNEEFISLLEIAEDMLSIKTEERVEESGGCCSGGDCC